jgi:hypothetical protein
MLALLTELVAEWRKRLSDCRDALRAADEDGAEVQYLRIHERILKYLLDRYEHAPPEPTSHINVVRRTRRYPPPLPIYVEVSENHPPRSRLELRNHLDVIHSTLRPPQRTWWSAVTRRRPAM